jgi:GntR family transcriptional regulator
VLLSLPPADGRPIYLQIMDEVRRMIAMDVLGPDTPLPSVRQLAADLRINPNTVAQAYRELEREDIVYVRRGQGTFVRRSAATGDLKRTQALTVAERALLDAHRNGLTAEDLITALLTLSAEGNAS